MPQLEPLNLKLTGSADGLSVALGKAEKDVGGFGSSVGGIGSKLTGLISAVNPVTLAIGAAMAGAAVAATGAAIAIGKIREAMTTIDDTTDAANRLGVSFTELQGLRLSLGEATGMEDGAIDAAIAKLQVNLGEAAEEGSGKVHDALASLGLDASQLLAAGPQKAVEMIAAKVSQVDDKSQQLKLAFDILGKSGIGIAAALRESPEALQESAKWAQENLSLTQQQVEQVGSANDAWGRVADKINNIWQQIAAEVSPLLEVIADDILGLGENFDGMDDVVKVIVDSMAQFYGFSKDLFELWSGTNPIIQAWRVLNGDIEGAQKAFQDGITFDGMEKMQDRLDRARQEAEGKSKNGGGASDAEVEALEAAAKLNEASTKAVSDQLEASVKLAQDSIKEMEGNVESLAKKRESALSKLQSEDGPLSATSDRASQIKRVAEIQSKNKSNEQLQKQAVALTKEMVEEQKNLAGLVQKLIDQGADGNHVMNLD